MLMPGLIFTLPGNAKWLSIFSYEVNTYAVIVHSILYILAISSIMGINILLIDPTLTRILRTD
jgi:hypothetical protein